MGTVMATVTRWICSVLEVVSAILGYRCSPRRPMPLDEDQAAIVKCAGNETVRPPLVDPWRGAVTHPCEDRKLSCVQRRLPTDHPHHLQVQATLPACTILSRPLRPTPNAPLRSPSRSGCAAPPANLPLTTGKFAGRPTVRISRRHAPRPSGACRLTKMNGQVDHMPSTPEPADSLDRVTVLICACAQ